MSQETNVDGADHNAAADDAPNVNAAKLAAEDYAFAELTKAIASFGMTIVEPSK